MLDLYKIQELLQQRAEYLARIKLIPYDGSPEVKEINGGKYLYVRKREAGKLSSTYVNMYSDELYQLLLRNAKERRTLNKNVRHINKKLADLGYEENGISIEVRENIAFARINMKNSIYDQAVLEGVGTTFPQTEEIIEQGVVHGVSTTDVQKILNLKHAWEFILDEDVIQSDTNYYLLCYIARLVNEGLMYDGGRIRGIPVTIGGSNYIPPIPIELDVQQHIIAITEQKAEAIDIAVELCMYCMKAQIFKDGNKRASVIFANHYLISHAAGFMVIPKEEVSEFKKILVEYYEGAPLSHVATFIKEKCWKQLS